jgi:hypothetical protein
VFENIRLIYGKKEKSSDLVGRFSRKRWWGEILICHQRTQTMAEIYIPLK